MERRPIHMAPQEGQVEVVRFLPEDGADEDKTKEEEEEEEGQLQVLRFLCEAGADRQRQHGGGWMDSPLFCCPGESVTVSREGRMNHVVLKRGT